VERIKAISFAYVVNLRYSTHNKKVTDAIETLDPGDGRRTLEELTGRGARLINTDEALGLLEAAAPHHA